MADTTQITPTEAFPRKRSVSDYPTNVKRPCTDSCLSDCGLLGPFICF